MSLLVSDGRSLFAPEVVQSSALDCGPAALHSLLRGFGVPASYGRLREACQTTVDGTSIDDLEDVAVRLGLEAEQILVPVDHILLPEFRTLPAIVVVLNPSGMTHFVLVWRRIGRWLQVMDPAVGRRWIRHDRFLAEVYRHAMTVPATAWHEWTRTEDFTRPLGARLTALGVNDAEERVARAIAAAGWEAPACLDAATRFVAALVEADGLRVGAESARALDSLIERASVDGDEETSPAIPDRYWSVRPGLPDDEEPTLFARGAVLVRTMGRRARIAGDRTPTVGSDTLSDVPPPVTDTADEDPLAAVVTEPADRPLRAVIDLVRSGGRAIFTRIGLALVLSAATVLAEALLFRGVFELGRDLVLPFQRAGAFLILAMFSAIILALDLVAGADLLRLGRKIEIQFRLAFYEKLGRMHDRYFQSRLTSDMSERAHQTVKLRRLPELGGRLLRVSVTLLFTMIGLIWLHPPGTPIVILAGLAAVGVPLLFHPLLAERDLRFRTHAGALSRFYLDALIGLVAIRAHRAESSVAREHEAYTVRWAQAAFGLQRAVVAVQTISSLAGFGLAGWLLLDLARRSTAGAEPSALLIVYWALQVPVLGQLIAGYVREYPEHRSALLRLLEPLHAMEEPKDGGEGGDHDVGRGADIQLEGVSVKVGGHIVLHDVSLRVSPGEKVAVLGASGAGKSTLVGLLLGFHLPDVGSVLVDGHPLVGETRDRLRNHTAWIEPGVHLWNASVWDNVTFGVGGRVRSDVVHRTGLDAVVERLPDGLRSVIGDRGRMVSGGEGQRVRFARGMAREGVRFVLLDEAGRGLGRVDRTNLVHDVVHEWPGATVLCVTHDLDLAQTFDRVIVMEGGCIVEDGAPELLSTDLASRYAALRREDREGKALLWSDPRWRSVHVEDGRVSEDGGAP